jgi:Ca2+-binding RTX toxin-like protein
VDQGSRTFALVGLTALAAAIGPVAVATATASHVARHPNVKCHGHVATIVGTTHRGTLTGTDGRDVIVDLATRETIHARGGNDLICSRKGGDFIWGGPGADHVYIAGQTVDFVHGGPGDDVIHGGRGADELYGGRGADVLRAGGIVADPDPEGPVDTLRGGPGRDRLYNEKSGEDLPGAGNDLVSRGTVDYSQASARVSVDLAAGRATGRSIGKDTLQHVESVAGSQHADTIYGDDRRNVLGGFGGADYLDGRGGNDDLVDDEASASKTLIGGSGDDTLRDDKSDGDVADSADTLDGGPGDDVIFVPYGTNTIDGGSGTDWVVPGANTDETDGSTWTIDLGAGTVTNFGAQGHPERVYSSTVAGVEDAEGGFTDDVLRGDDGPNVLIGGTGNDQLYGEGGDDTLDTTYIPSPGNPQPSPASGDTADGGPGTDACRATTTTSCESTITGSPPGPRR